MAAYEPSCKHSFTSWDGQVTASAKPRRRAEEIRASLVEAAAGLFAQHGYNGVSVRDIATAAGVQASVVIRYFGSKEQLFRQVLNTCEPPKFHSQSQAQIAQTATRALLDLPEFPLGRNRTLVHAIAVRSLGSVEAREIIAADLKDRFINPLSQALAGEDSDARAALMMAVVMGVRMLRDIIGSPALAQANGDQLHALLQGIFERLSDPDRTESASGEDAAGNRTGL
jgi:AcrR family transcriptional regulator